MALASILMALGSCLMALGSCDRLVDQPVDGGNGDASTDGVRADSAARTRFDLVIAGAGLRAYDDARVFASVAELPAGPVTRAVATVMGGAFELRFPAALLAGGTTVVRVLLDSDGDGLCSGGELAFRRAFEIAVGAGFEATLPLAPRDFDVAGTLEDCDGF